MRGTVADHAGHGRCAYGRPAALNRVWAALLPRSIPQPRRLVATGGGEQSAVRANATPQTCPVWPVRACRRPPVPASHTRAVLSMLGDLFHARRGAGARHGSAVSPASVCSNAAAVLAGRLHRFRLAIQDPALRCRGPRPDAGPRALSRGHRRNRPFTLGSAQGSARSVSGPLHRRGRTGLAGMHDGGNSAHQLPGSLAG